MKQPTWVAFRDGKPIGVTLYAPLVDGVEYDNEATFRALMRARGWTEVIQMDWTEAQTLMQEAWGK